MHCYRVFKSYFVRASLYALFMCLNCPVQLQASKLAEPMCEESYEIFNDFTTLADEETTFGEH